MRLARLALIVSVVLMGTSGLRAQTAHTPSCDSCSCQSCQSCQSGCDCASCCGGGGMLSKLHSTLGGILPGSIGHDGRHQIYKAALCRNTFDKKYLLPIPYYCHIFPKYRHDRCCCGPRVPTAGCPTCGPHGAVGEEMIEMHEVPTPVPAEPTPAVQRGARQAPNIMAPSDLWEHQSVSRQTKGTKQAQKDRVAKVERSRTQTLRSFIPLVLRSEKQDTKVRQASAVQKRAQADPVNPLR